MTAIGPRAGPGVAGPEQSNRGAALALFGARMPCPFDAFQIASQRTGTAL
jgi:hypothetical protein